jgi:hypothetical protein
VEDHTQAQTFTTGLQFFFAPTLENYRDVIFDSSFQCQESLLRRTSLSLRCVFRLVAQDRGQDERHDRAIQFE